MGEKSHGNLRRFLIISIILLLTISIIFIFGMFPTGMLIGQPQNTTKIGLILASEEIFSGYNDCVQTGVQMAVDDINMLGGINGKRVEIILENDQGDSNVVKSIGKTLSNSGVVEIIIVKELFIIPLLNLSKEEKFIIAGTTYGGPTISPSDLILTGEPIGNYAFFLNGSVFRFKDFVVSPTLIMAEIAAKKLGLREVAIIYHDNVEGPVLSKNLFRRRFEALGGTILFESGFTSGVTDYTYMTDTLKETKPEAVFFTTGWVGGLGLKHLADILKEIKASGLNITLLGRSVETSLNQPSFVNLAGDAAEGFIFVSYNFNTHSHKYGRDFSTIPDPCVIRAYESVVIPAMAMEKCGEDVDCISNELHTGEFEGPTGKIRFREDGLIIRPYMIKVIKDGVHEDLYQYSLLENQ